MQWSGFSIDQYTALVLIAPNTGCSEVGFEIIKYHYFINLRIN